MNIRELKQALVGLHDDDEAIFVVGCDRDGYTVRLRTEGCESAFETEAETEE